MAALRPLSPPGNQDGTGNMKVQATCPDVWGSCPWGTCQDSTRLMQGPHGLQLAAAESIPIKCWDFSIPYEHVEGLLPAAASEDRCTTWTSQWAMGLQRTHAHERGMRVRKYGYGHGPLAKELLSKILSEVLAQCSV